MRTLIGLVALVLFVSFAVGAELPEPSVQKGTVTKQQVTLKNGEIITGTVVARTKEKIIIQTDNETVTYRSGAISEILNIEVEVEEPQVSEVEPGSQPQHKQSVVLDSQQGRKKFESVPAQMAQKTFNKSILDAESSYNKAIIRTYASYIWSLDRAFGVAMGSRNLEEATKINSEKVRIEELFKGLKSGQVEVKDKQRTLMKTQKNYAPKDAVKFNGHYYKIIEKSVSWKNAKKTSEMLRGHLVIIDSKEENDFIMSLIKEKQIKADLLWLGLSYDTKQRNWRWVDGKIAEYANWNRGQPNNPKKEPYSVLTNHHNGHYGLWHDTSYVSGHVKGYIIEWDK